MSSDPIDTLAKKGQLIQDEIKRLIKYRSTPDFEEVVGWQIDCGGKRIRPALTLLIVEAIGNKSIQETAILTTAAAVELIHNYSLVFDDIIDQGDLRRGKKTTRAKYGDELAIIAGLQLREIIDEAARQAGQEYFPKLSKLYSSTIDEMVEGERLDVLYEQKERSYDYYKSYQQKIVTEKDYMNMIWGKTGSLIKASCVAGAIIGDGSKDHITAAGEFGTGIGYAFQIMDDYLDLFAGAELGKQKGKDIIERKFGNYPLIKALQNLPADKKQELVEAIEGDYPESERVPKALNLIKQGKGDIEAKKTANELVQKAKSALETHFPQSKARDMLSGLAEYIVSRLY